MWKLNQKGNEVNINYTIRDLNCTEIDMGDDRYTQIFFEKFETPCKISIHFAPYMVQQQDPKDILQWKLHEFYKELYIIHEVFTIYVTMLTNNNNNILESKIKSMSPMCTS